MADTSYISKVYHKQGGDEQVVASGGLITIESGGSIVAAPGSSVTIDTVKTTSVTVGAAGSETALTVPVHVLYTSVTPTEGVIFCDRAYQLSSIYARPAVSAASAATLTFYKAGDGVGMASGTQLSTGSFDMQSTANVNKVIGLTASTTALTLATGDALGYVLTGASETARGSITFNLKPV